MKTTQQIILDNGMGVLVSKADFKRLSEHAWKAAPSGRNFYAYRNIKTGPLFMHKDIAVNAGIYRVGMELDHKNNNTLDCRRSNLRAATRNENLSNRAKFTTYGGKPCSSQFKGVTLSGNKQKWIGQLRNEGQLYYLGTFDTQEEAAVAYNRAAKEFFGEFAQLNTQPVIKKIEKVFEKINKTLGSTYANNLIAQLN